MVPILQASLCSSDTPHNVFSSHDAPSQGLPPAKLPFQVALYLRLTCEHHRAPISGRQGSIKVFRVVGVPHSLRSPVGGAAVAVARLMQQSVQGVGVPGQPGIKALACKARQLSGMISKADSCGRMAFTLCVCRPHAAVQAKH